jgi:hypothetical protein
MLILLEVLLQTSISIQILLLEQMNHQTLFGYEYYGVNASNGNPIYVKANGALQGNIPTQSYVAYDPLIQQMLVLHRHY